MGRLWIAFFILIPAFGLLPARASAAEADLERTFFRDGLATALVIVRNDDEPRGYRSVTLECIFHLDDRAVGRSSMEIKDLRFHQHSAARLTTTVEGDKFDRAECHIVQADRG